jgi:hypothetical protein
MNTTFYLCIAFEGRQLFREAKASILKQFENKIKKLFKKFLIPKNACIFAIQFERKLQMSSLKDKNTILRILK